MYGWGSWTRTNGWRDQNPLPYQLGYTPIRELHIFRQQWITNRIKNDGWGSWTRTNGWRDQNPLPYQLGYTPFVKHNARQ